MTWFRPENRTDKGPVPLYHMGDELGTLSCAVLFGLSNQKSLLRGPILRLKSMHRMVSMLSYIPTNLCLTGPKHQPPPL